MPIQKISPGATNAETAANSINQAIDLAEQNTSKLAGIEAGATKNASDAELRDRATHTGTQPIATVDGLQPALDGKLAKQGDTLNTVSEKTDSSTSATLDWGAFMVFVRDIKADTVFAFDNVPSVGSTKREMHLLNAGSFLVEFPSSNFQWIDGTPTFGTVDRVIYSQYQGDSVVYAEHRSIVA